MCVTTKNDHLCYGALQKRKSNNRKRHTYFIKPIILYDDVLFERFGRVNRTHHNLAICMMGTAWPGASDPRKIL